MSVRQTRRKSSLAAIFGSRSRRSASVLGQKNELSIPNSCKTLSASEDDTESLSSIGDSVEGGCLKVRSQRASLQQTYTNTKDGKSVRFDTVQVRCHEVILGDNPAVTAGPPVTIKWIAFETETISVDEFECLKPKPVRRGPDMLIPISVRENVLKSAGYARSHMVEAQREVAKIRKSRAVAANQAVLSQKWRKLIEFRPTTTTR
jgi:hypothetical protein